MVRGRSGVSSPLPERENTRRVMQVLHAVCIVEGASEVNERNRGRLRGGRIKMVWYDDSEEARWIC